LKGPWGDSDGIKKQIRSVLLSFLVRGVNFAKRQGGSEDITRLLWGSELDSCPALVLRSWDPSPLSLNTNKIEN